MRATAIFACVALSQPADGGALAALRALEEGHRALVSELQEPCPAVLAELHSSLVAADEKRLEAPAAGEDQQSAAARALLQHDFAASADGFVGRAVAALPEEDAESPQAKAKAAYANWTVEVVRTYRHAVLALCDWKAADPTELERALERAPADRPVAEVAAADAERAPPTPVDQTVSGTDPPVTALLQAF